MTITAFCIPFSIMFNMHALYVIMYSNKKERNHIYERKSG